MDVTGFDLDEVGEGRDSAAQFAQFTQRHPEVVEDFGSIRMAGPNEFQQLRSFPELPPLEHGNGGLDGIGAGRDPANRDQVGRYGHDAVSAQLTNLLAEKLGHRLMETWRRGVRGALGKKHHVEGRKGDRELFHGSTAGFAPYL